MVNNPPASAGDMGGTSSIPGSERSPGERNGNLFQYSCLGNPVDRGASWGIVGGVQSLDLQRVRHNLATKQQQQQCTPCENKDYFVV